MEAGEPADPVFKAGSALLVVALVIGCDSGTADVDAGAIDSTTGSTETSAAECSDGLDNDGDGAADCADLACRTHAFCNDGGPPPDVDGGPAAEVSPAECSDGVDNDGDGATDCADVACQTHAFCNDGGPPPDVDGGPAAEVSPAECSDGVDNDGDGATDCEDVACRTHAFCSGDGGPAGMDAGPDAGPTDAGAMDAGFDGATADAGFDAGSDSGPIDAATGPCMGIPTTGRCVSSTRIETCLVPSGSTGPTPVYFDCPVGSVCDDTGPSAYCRLTASCIESDTQCLADGVTLRTCTGGSWVPSTCARDCVRTALGDGCGLDISTRSFSGTVQYEARAPNSSYTDWATSPFLAPAQGFLVLTYRGPDLIDAVQTTTGLAPTGGRFTIRLPSIVTAADVLVVAAAAPSSTGDLAYVVADAGWAPSSTPRDTLTPPPAPRAWSWAIRLDSVTSGDTLTISTAAGSGAARVFDYTRYVYGLSEGVYLPTSPRSILVWLGLGTRWDCGACAAPWPALAFGLEFDSRIWIAGGTDEGYWSDPVTAHELGHYVMDAYGVSPGEGGPHVIGRVTHPGQAWSEGWATYFSSYARSSSLYWDKLGGGMFWVDVAARTYGSGISWPRPTPAGGLLQLMDENEVAAMLWALDRRIGSLFVLFGLDSPHMTTAPFPRGYTRRQWSGLASPVYFDTGESVPFVADMFDALLCDGFASASDINAVTEPLTRYPFPASSPLCPAPESPITVRWESATRSGSLVRLHAVVERAVPMTVPFDYELRLPPGVSLVRGQGTRRLPANAHPRVDRIEFEVDAQQTDADVVLVGDAVGAGFRYHGEIPYRFGRPAPAGRTVSLAPFDLRVGSRSFGRPVQIDREPSHRREALTR